MKKAFSLMEMMVVLLIVSVIAAASAPMINKKTLSAAAEKSPWVWTIGRSIAFNLNGDDESSVVIGDLEPPEGNQKPRFVVATKKPQGSDNPVPHISFIQTGGSNPVNKKLWISDKSIILGPNYAENSTIFGGNYINEGGNFAPPSGLNIFGNITVKSKGDEPLKNITAIGSSTIENSRNSIVIGNVGIKDRDGAIRIGYRDADNDIDSRGPIQVGLNTASNEHSFNSIAIGHGAEIINNSPDDISKGEAIAIGTEAKANSPRAISLGISAESGKEAIAIGYDSSAEELKAIAIGSHAIAKKNAIAIGGTLPMYDQDNQYDGKTEATEMHAIAIGTGAKAKENSSIAIGGCATSSGSCSVAIGSRAKATKNQIVLGGDLSAGGTGIYPTVYIPGNLVVDGNVYLARKEKSKLYANLPLAPDGTGETNAVFMFWRSGGENNTVRFSTSKLIKSKDVPLSAPSDRRLKDVGKAFTGGLEEIKKLEVFNYTFKKDKEKTPRVGVMAQDLQKIFPKAVFKGDDGFLRIRMEDMFYALVNAVKELDKKIDLLVQKQKKIDELESKVDKLEKRLAELEKKIK